MKRILEALVVMVAELQSLLKQLWCAERDLTLVTLKGRLESLDPTTPKTAQDTVFKTIRLQIHTLWHSEKTHTLIDYVRLFDRFNIVIIYFSPVTVPTVESISKAKGLVTCTIFLSGTGVKDSASSELRKMTGTSNPNLDR